MTQASERAGWRDLAPFVRMFGDARAWILIGLLLTFTTLLAGFALLGISGGFLTATAIAGLTPATAIAFNFFYPAATIRFLAITRTASRWGERVVTHEATFRLLATIRVWLYRHIAPLSPTQLGRYHGGDLLTRLTRDVDALDNLYQRLLLPALAAFLILLALAAAVAVQSTVLVWPVVLLMLGALILFPWLAWQSGRALGPALIAQRAQLRAHLLDSVDGCEDFSLHAPAWAMQRSATLRTAAHWIGDQLVLQRRGAQLRALTALAVPLGAWAALGLAASLPESRAISGPWIAAIVLLMLGTAEVLQALPAAWLELPGTVAAAQRLRALALQSPAPAFPERGPAPADGSLTLDRVGYAHDPATIVLENATLHLATGEHVALTGPSGCGKSTLASLVARLEDPQAGRILTGGVALAALDETTLREHIASLSQDAWIFTMTLAQNLRLANPQADDTQLTRVLELVGLAATVARWPDGLATWIDEGGASLSGGQRRRLALARTLLRDARIYILDEPSEGLEAAAHAELVRRVRQHLHGRTVLWITHLQEGLGSFDRVLRLESGAITEPGGAAGSIDPAARGD